jgi:hypothetical protein
MLALQSYQELASALHERLSVIGDREFYARDPVAHLAKLQAVSERIVTLQTELPPPLDPQLAHFLQRSSYDKALMFIEEYLAANRS